MKILYLDSPSSIDLTERIAINKIGIPKANFQTEFPLLNNEKFDIFFVAGSIILFDKIDPRHIKEQYGNKDSIFVVFSGDFSFLEAIKKQFFGVDFFEERLDFFSKVFYSFSSKESFEENIKKLYFTTNES